MCQDQKFEGSMTSIENENAVYSNYLHRIAFCKMAAHCLVAVFTLMAVLASVPVVMANGATLKFIVAPGPSVSLLGLYGSFCAQESFSGRVVSVSDYEVSWGQQPLRSASLH